jgi:hypothetical protein
VTRITFERFVVMRSVDLITNQMITKQSALQERIAQVARVIGQISLGNHKQGA